MQKQHDKTLRQAEGVWQFRLAVLMLSSLGLIAGCSGGSRGSSSQSSLPATAHLSGLVTSGQKPIAGAAVTAWAANATPGAPATQLGQGVSDSEGMFNMALTTQPSDGQLVYVTASGGQVGTGTNNAILLMTVAGAFCSGNGCNFPQTVTINELSTVYSAYALAAFSSVNSSLINVAGFSPGLPNAAKTFGYLMDAVSGQAAFVDSSSCTGSSTAPADCYSFRKMNTLANYLANCVDSSGATSTACSGLFAQTQASNIFAAALNLATQAKARNAGAAVFALGTPPTVYSPVLANAPADWTLTLQHTGGGLYAPAGIAVDAEGDLWIANNFTDQNAGSVTELSPIGAPLSPAGGFTDTSLAGPIAIAVDQSGNVWVANYSQGGGKAVTEFDHKGNSISGAGGYEQDILGPAALAVTPDGKIWVANSGNSSLTLLNSSGAPYLTVNLQGGLAFPVSLALDAQGNVWAANQGGDSVSEFTAGGTPLSGTGGYTGGGISSPTAIAIDMNGNAWVANQLSGATALVGGDTPPPSCPASPVSGDTGCPLSPVSGFTGGGLHSPAGIAVDGDDNIWFSNFLTGSISEFNDKGVALSPSSGYQAGAQLSLPYGLAVDSSGNLWVTNYANDSVTEFVGIAAPVATPLVGPPNGN